MHNAAYHHCLLKKKMKNPAIVTFFSQFYLALKNMGFLSEEKYKQQNSGKKKNWHVVCLDKPKQICNLC